MGGHFPEVSTCWALGVQLHEPSAFGASPATRRVEQWQSNGRTTSKCGVFLRIMAREIVLQSGPAVQHVRRGLP